MAKLLQKFKDFFNPKSDTIKEPSSIHYFNNEYWQKYTKEITMNNDCTNKIDIEVSKFVIPTKTKNIITQSKIIVTSLLNNGQRIHPNYITVNQEIDRILGENRERVAVIISSDGNNHIYLSEECTI